MPVLICYDISQNSLRAKMGKKIIEFGLDRINKSVYLGSIAERSLTLLENELSQWLTAKGSPNDSVIVLEVGPQQVESMRIYGRNDLDKEELSGRKTTLIL